MPVGLDQVGSGGRMRRNCQLNVETGSRDSGFPAQRMRARRGRKLLLSVDQGSVTRRKINLQLRD